MTHEQLATMHDRSGPRVLIFDTEQVPRWETMLDVTVDADVLATSDWHRMPDIFILSRENSPEADDYVGLQLENPARVRIVTYETMMKEGLTGIEGIMGVIAQVSWCHVRRNKGACEAEVQE